jgi:hypothetical protein
MEPVLVPLKLWCKSGAFSAHKTLAGRLLFNIRTVLGIIRCGQASEQSINASIDGPVSADVLRAVEFLSEPGPCARMVVTSVAVPQTTISHVLWHGRRALVVAVSCYVAIARLVCTSVLRLDLSKSGLPAFAPACLSVAKKVVQPVSP